MKAKKPRKPTHVEATWLRRIAHTAMMKTYSEARQVSFVLASTGEKIPTNMALILITNGWVKGQRDGMFDDPQSYVVLTP